MADPKVKITVDESQALASLNKLGASFDRAADKGKALGSKVSQPIDRTSESVKLLGSRMGETVKSFLAFEFAKKIVATADAAMRAASTMSGLSAATRENAAAYIENTAAAKKSFDEIILSTAGFMSTLATYAAEGLGFWSQILGADAEANSRAIQTAQANAVDALTIANKAAEGIKKAKDKLNGSLSESDRSFYEKSLVRLQNQYDTYKAMEKTYRGDMNELVKTGTKDAAAQQADFAKADAAKILALKISASNNERTKLKLKYDADLTDAKGREDLKLAITKAYNADVARLNEKELTDKKATNETFKNEEKKNSEAILALTGMREQSMVALMVNGSNKRLAELKLAQKKETDSFTKQSADQLAIIDASITAKQSKKGGGDPKEIESLQAQKEKLIVAQNNTLRQLEVQQEEQTQELRNSLSESRRTLLRDTTASEYEAKKNAILDEEARLRKELEQSATPSGGGDAEAKLADAKAYEDALLALKKDTNKQLQDLDKEQAQNRINLEYDQAELITALTESKYDDVMNDYERRKELAEVQIEDDYTRITYLAELQKANAREVGEVEREERQKTINAYTAWGDAAAGAIGGVAKLLATNDMKERKRRMEYKTFAIAEVIVNTAIAISKAYAQLGPVLGTVAAVGLVGVGIAQGRTIASQKFAKGGIVQGPRTGDQVPVNANGREMILTESQQAELFSIAKGNAGGGSGGGVTFAPVINGTQNLMGTKQMLRDSYTEFQSFIKTVLADPRTAQAKAFV